MILGARPIGTVAYMGGLPALLEPFCWSWGQMIQYNAEFLCDDKHYVHYNKTSISLHDAARNQLAKTFLGDWIVMLDTDHAFEPDIVHRMLNIADAIKADVLSGIYQFKAPPYSPVVYAWDEDFDLPAPIADWSQEADVLEVQSVGAGCLFIRRGVLDRILNELKEEPFTRTYPLGEDHSFCKRCKQLGISIWLAPNIHSKHLRIHQISIGEYDKSKVQMASEKPTKGYEI